MSNLYEDFTDFLDDHEQDYDSGKTLDMLDNLNDDVRYELEELLDNDDLSYEEFSDFCYEHDIRYHG